MITCAVCGKKTAKEEAVHRTVHLLGRKESYDVRAFNCSACGESFMNDEQVTANEREERRATTRALAEIGGAELRFVRELADITQPEFENALGLGRNTVARWETGARDVPPYIKTMVRLLALNPTALILLREQETAPGDVLVDAERSPEPMTGTVKARQLPSYLRVLAPTKAEIDAARAKTLSLAAKTVHQAVAPQEWSAPRSERKRA